MIQRDELISKLVSKINGNQNKVDNHVVASQDVHDHLTQKIDELRELSDKVSKQETHKNQLIKGSILRIGNTIKVIGKNNIVEKGGLRISEKEWNNVLKDKKTLFKEMSKGQKNFRPTSGTKVVPPKPSAIIPSKPFAGKSSTKTIVPLALVGVGAATLAAKSGKPASSIPKRTFFPFFHKKSVPAKPKKPTIFQRMGARVRMLGRRIKFKTKMGVKKIKRAISNSIVGKTYRAVKKGVVFAYKVVAGVVKAAWKTVKFAYKTAVFAVKTFYKASKIVGKIAVMTAKVGVFMAKAVWNAGKRVVTAFKDLTKALPGKAKIAAIFLAPLAIFHGGWSPAWALTKLGFRAIGFVFRKLWQGLKRLVFKTANVFKNLFNMLGNFANKTAFWIAKLGHGIKDKAYRFLVKPIANMMRTAFGFTKSMLMAPVKFMQNLIPTIFDKVRNTMSNLKQAVRRVYDES